MYEIFVQQCVIRPQFLHLKRAYETYKLDHGQPCKAGVTNQCAVRMSIALARSGFGLESFQPRSRVHAGVKCQTEGVPHVLGANELASFLSKTLFQPEVYSPSGKKAGCGSAYERVAGRTGILYFNNCFTRSGDKTKSGDHIDLFDGSKYYNQILHPRAGGNESSIGNLFAASDRVWFWQLA
jgi:hypothetical protein